MPFSVPRPLLFIYQTFLRSMFRISTQYPPYFKSHRFFLIVMSMHTHNRRVCYVT